MTKPATPGSLVTTTAQPKHVARGEGKVYQLGRLTLTVKIAAADNAAAYTLCEAFEPPGWSAALLLRCLLR